MPAFRATIALLDINPFVAVPPAHLRRLMAAAGKQTGALPVSVRLGGVTFRQNVVKYRGVWRLYLNGPMRKAAGKDVGARVLIELAHDPEPRHEPLPPMLRQAFARAPRARAAFRRLTPSRQREISRYLGRSRTDATLERNVGKVVRFLLGEEEAGLVVLQERRRPTAKAAARKRRVERKAAR